MKDIIKLTYDFLTSHTENSNMSKEEVAYRNDHSLRVANIAKFLAEQEGADVKLCTIAGLLHDVGKFDTEINKDHGRVSAKIAREFLKTLGLEYKEIENICYAIAVHVDGECGYDYEHTLEAKIVGDADNLDRYGAYRIYQSMIWNEDSISGSIEDRINAVQRMRQHRISLLNEFHLDTKTADEIWKESLAYHISFFDRYLKELAITQLPSI